MAWGRPSKVEITGALVLAVSGHDGEGGIKDGLALPCAYMEVFRTFYLDLLANLC